MFEKAKRLYRALGSLSRQAEERLDLEFLKCNLSPVDKFIALSGVNNEWGLFNSSYEAWRVKRLAKMLEIYDLNLFKGRRLIEVGAGHGDIGAFFADLGAQVLCLDGRLQNVNFARLKHRKVSGISFEQFNLENDFCCFGKFDFLINFGLIYHLRNVEEHLRACFAVADDMILETVVCDSTDPYKILFREERTEVDEEALDGIGSRPSPFYIERIANENNFEFTRYFTPDLNVGKYFCYDWQHKNDCAPNDDFVNRRLWRIRRAGNSV